MTVNKTNRLLLIAGSIALTFLLMFALLPSLRGVPTLAYNATVRVEINPAFDVIVDQDDLVVEIIKLNDDALGFDSEPWIGKPVEEVINALIAYALEAGFIDEEALESDVVSVTVITDEDEEDEVKEAIDNLGQRIQERLKNQEEAMKVDVVFIKATLRELFEAEGKEVPLGLYVIQGKVLQEDGTLIPMKEYLAQEKPNQALVQLKRSVQSEIKALSAQIRELNKAGEDTSELQLQLEELKLQLLAYQEQLDALDDDEEKLDDEDLEEIVEEQNKAIESFVQKIKEKQNNGKKPVR